MDWVKRNLFVASVIAVAIVISLGVGSYFKSDNAFGVVSQSVHSLLDGYAEDFRAASAEVGKTITTDADLQSYLEARTKSTRTKAASVVDAYLQDKLPRDINKLNAESAAFLLDLSNQYAKEAKSHE